MLISEAHSKCYFAFEDLIQAIEHPARDFQAQIPLENVEDEFQKYKLWAGNNGAAHSGQRYEISLDYRLREASFFRIHVLKLLMTLHDRIKDASSLLRNERKPFEEFVAEVDPSSSSASEADEEEQEESEESPWEISSNSTGSNNTDKKGSQHRARSDNADTGAVTRTETVDNSSSNPISTLGATPTLEMPRLLESIKFTITCLYRVPIRKPAPLDRIKHKTSLESSPYQWFDVLYVMDKFPNLKRTVATRLGKMITRRRQILLYRDLHDSRLDTSRVRPKVPHPMPMDTATGSTSELPKSTVSGQIALSHTDHSHAASSHFTLNSKATTLRLAEAQVEGPIDETALFAPSVAESKSSVASSFAGKDLRVEVPPRPKGEDGNELDRFECPYCLVTKFIGSDHRWKKHVLDDLQPYTCTFDDCDLYDHFFDNRDEWFNHEAQQHRVKWFCNVESHPEFGAKLDFVEHMQTDHGVKISDGLLEMFRRPSKNNVGPCNLCFRESKNLKSHVSRHLQQISLFALPRVNETAGSGQAKRDDKSSRLVRLKKEERPDERSSQSSSMRSSSVSNADEPHDPSTSERDATGLLDIDDQVEEVHVPDTVEITWDDVTDKFSKARQITEHEARPVEESPGHYLKEMDRFDEVYPNFPDRWVVEYIGRRFEGHTMSGNVVDRLALHVAARRVELSANKRRRRDTRVISQLTIPAKRHSDTVARQPSPHRYTRASRNQKQPSPTTYLRHYEIQRRRSDDGYLRYGSSTSTELEYYRPYRRNKATSDEMNGPVARRPRAPSPDLYHPRTKLTREVSSQASYLGRPSNRKAINSVVVGETPSKATRKATYYSSRKPTYDPHIISPRYNTRVAAKQLSDKATYHTPRKSAYYTPRRTSYYAPRKTLQDTSRKATYYSPRETTYYTVRRRRRSLDRTYHKPRPSYLVPRKAGRYGDRTHRPSLWPFRQNPPIIEISGAPVPVTCSYCDGRVHLSKRDAVNDWKKHVLQDIKPYVCLEEECTLATTRWADTDEWFEHMERQSVVPLECCFCGYWPDDFKKEHLAGHLRDLAAWGVNPAEKGQLVHFYPLDESSQGTNAAESPLTDDQELSDLSEKPVFEDHGYLEQFDNSVIDDTVPPTLTDAEDGQSGWEFLGANIYAPNYQKLVSPNAATSVNPDFWIVVKEDAIHFIQESFDVQPFWEKDDLWKLWNSSRHMDLSAEISYLEVFEEVLQEIAVPVEMGPVPNYWKRKEEFDGDSTSHEHEQGQENKGAKPID